MTHAEYLEAYHEGSEAVRRELATLMARNDPLEALATLQRWDVTVDALWAQVQTPA